MTNPGGAGAVVVVPVALPPPRSASALADAMVQTTDQSTVRRRWGLILAINNDGTVNVDLAGVVIPNLRVVAGYQPTIGERIILDVVGTDMTVLGATGQSPRRFNRPTGDIEPSIRKTPKPDTLLLNGQTVSRVDYARLFAWVQQEGLLTTAQTPNNLFGAGDGSTTFTLPDFRGRTVVGADATNPLGTKFGADSRALVPENLPLHNHTVSDHPGHTHSVNDHGTHSHGFSTDSQGSHGHSVSVSNADHWHAMDSQGNHGGHFNGTMYMGANGPDIGWAAWDSGGTVRGAHGHSTGVNTHGHSASAASGGSHSHSGTTGSGGAQSHTVNANSAQGHSVSNFGSATPVAVDVRQPSFAISWLIWV